MVNTMEDLREEVATRLRNSLHGREIDTMEDVTPELAHMLGITPLNKLHDPNNEEMTLLDTKHPFWQDYEENIDTRNKVTQKIETAIRSLEKDGTFRMTYPYGEEADIFYVEVDKITSTSNDMKTSCRDCGALLTTQPNLSQEGFRYTLKFSLDCPECDFCETYKHKLART